MCPSWDAVTLNAKMYIPFHRKRCVFDGFYVPWTGCSSIEFPVNFLSPLAALIRITGAVSRGVSSRQFAELEMQLHRRRVWVTIIPLRADRVGTKGRTLGPRPRYSVTFPLPVPLSTCRSSPSNVHGMSRVSTLCTPSPALSSLSYSQCQCRSGR